jgi:hypothetical protein
MASSEEFYSEVFLGGQKCVRSACALMGTRIMEDLRQNPSSVDPFLITLGTVKEPAQVSVNHQRKVGVMFRPGYLLKF